MLEKRSKRKSNSNHEETAEGYQEKAKKIVAAEQEFL